MKPVDIGPADLETVRRVLREHVPGLEVWAFGSRVSWTARETSDLDIALMTTEPLNVMRLAEMREAFVQSDLPFRVDIVDWSPTSKFFRRVIEQDHVILVGKDRHNEWNETLFVNCATLVSEKVSPSEMGDVPYIGLGHIDEDTLSLGSHGIASDVTSTKTQFKRGDILFGKLRPYFRKVIMAPFGGICSTDIWVVRPLNGIDARFLFYKMASQEFVHVATQGSEGTRMPRAKWEFVSRMSCLIPPLPEQRAIAHVLGVLDDKIELNRQMNRTLEEMARALFKSWFVNFDPVRAKMDGRWRPGESLPGLPAHLYDLFSDSLMDSELGEIPNGWEVKTLDQLTKLNPREPMKKGVVAPYLDMAALPTSGSSSDDAVLREFTSGTRFRNKDTLLARITPCLENGKAAFIQSLLNYAVGWGSTEFIVMRAIPPVPPEYAYLLARNPDFRAHAIQSMTGTSGRQRAQTEALASYPLPFPSVDIWLAFGLIVGQLFARMKSNNEEMHTLIATRDALLPKLISGELRIFQLAHERGMLK